MGSFEDGVREGLERGVWVIVIERTSVNKDLIPQHLMFVSVSDFCFVSTPGYSCWQKCDAVQMIGRSKSKVSM